MNAHRVHGVSIEFGMKWSKEVLRLVASMFIIASSVWTHQAVVSQTMASGSNKEHD